MRAVPNDSLRNKCFARVLLLYAILYSKEVLVWMLLFR